MATKKTRVTLPALARRHLIMLKERLGGTHAEVVSLALKTLAEHEFGADETCRIEKSLNPKDQPENAPGSP